MRKKVEVKGRARLSAFSAARWTGSLVFSLLLAHPLLGQEAEPEDRLLPRPSVTALAISEPIKVDGRLDEPAWQQAQPATGFTQRDPEPGEPAINKTEVRILYTKDVLYVGVWAFQDPSTVIASEMQRDSAQFRDDSVMLFFDTFNDDRNAYVFETNPNGARTDIQVTDEGRDTRIDWDGIWSAVGRKGPQGWVAELAIPFSTIRFDPSADTWGFNVRRLVPRTHEVLFWAPMLDDMHLWRVSQYGELKGLEGLQSGSNLRVKPFVVGREGSFAETPPEALEDDLEVGLDLKWGITRELDLDLTVNTDFAETEVDEQRVNLTRFPLFFPEKRDFFLDNAGIFEFGPGNWRSGPPLLKIFHSRTIGLQNGEEVPLDWGARLSGRAGEWNLGLMNIQTDSTRLSDDTLVQDNNWTVMRAQRNLGKRSGLGMILTNREGENGDSNRVYGLDANISPTRRLTLHGWGVRSEDSDPEVEDDWAGGFSMFRRGRVWRWGVDATHVGETFRPDAGFLLRDNIRRYGSIINYYPRPKNKKSRVRNYLYALRADFIEGLDKDRAETARLNLDVYGIRFKTEDTLTFFIDRTFEELDEPFEIVSGVAIAPGDYYYTEYGIQFTSNPSRLVYANGGIQNGRFFDGNRFRSLIIVGYRPNKHFLLETNWETNNINLPAGNFNVNLLRQRFAYSFGPNLLTNVFLQHNGLLDVTTVNLRFDWIYKPGANLILVYNQIWDSPDLEFSSRDRQLILKLTYLFQR
ncbi:MAG: DUF5916 domain-containing protein [Acidobacteriota bacterium]